MGYLTAEIVVENESPAASILLETAVNHSLINMAELLSEKLWNGVGSYYFMIGVPLPRKAEH